MKHKLKFKTLILGVMILGLSFSQAYANEDAHSGGHESGGGEHGGGHESGGGEHGGGHEGAAAPKVQAPGWTEVINNITMLDGKIRVGQDNIEKLLQEKHHLPQESPLLKQITLDLAREYKELRKAIEEQNALKQKLRYRFPEMNAKEGRKYQDKKAPTIEEMEKSMGVDGKLDRNLKKMRQQMGSHQKVKPVEAAPKKETDPTEERIILEK